MRTSETTGNIAAALAVAQGEFKNPETNKTVTVQTKDGRSYSYNYATLPLVLDVTRAALSKNGLSHLCVTTMADKGTFLTCRLAHKSGEWYEAEMPLSSGLAPKDLAGQLTYFRRYLLSMMIGVAGDDDIDDADTIGERAPKRSPAAQDHHSATSERNTTGGLSVKQIDLLKAVYAQSGMPSEEFARILIAHKANSIEDLRWQSFNNVLDAVKKYKK
jgi:hypothetical protein